MKRKVHKQREAEGALGAPRCAHERQLREMAQALEVAVYIHKDFNENGEMKKDFNSYLMRLQ